MARRPTRTTAVGYTNRHQQRVVRNTGRAGTHNQTAYELVCLVCRRTHECNGADIFQRRCPRHDPLANGYRQ